MQTAAIIVAAGRGTRAGGVVPKQWQMLAGRPVIASTIDAFRGQVDRIILVIHPDDRPQAALLGDDLVLVAGGTSRAGSVKNALEALADDPPEKVLIHDGARPLIPAQVIARVLQALDSAAGAAPAVQVTDALWRGRDGRVVGTQDRANLWRAQTPQGFRFDPILSAHRAHPGDAADDVEVARAAGLDVAIVEGDEDNLKLTFPGDFARAERILAARKR